jgi:hypothetical protein
MKARLLKKLLNDTGYSVSNNRDYIAVGSPMCHDLISVNKDTLQVKYALDTFREGRKCFEETSRQSEKTELLFIWDKLHELIENEQMKDIINGKDEIDNPLPVFTVENGQLVESCTDKYGWPNTDDNGICMYENTHFSTKEEAIKYGIEDAIAGQNIYNRRIKDLEEDLSKAKAEVEKFKGYVSHLQSL